MTTRLLDASRGRQYLSATLGQSFYFADPRVTLPGEPVRDRSSSDIVAEVELAAFKNWNARFGYQWNPDETQSERSETFIQYNPSPGRVLNAGYRFRRDLLEQVDVSGAWPISEPVARLRALGVLAAGREDARPVPRRRILVLLLGRPRW